MLKKPKAQITNAKRRLYSPKLKNSYQRKNLHLIFVICYWDFDISLFSPLSPTYLPLVTILRHLLGSRQPLSYTLFRNKKMALASHFQENIRKNLQIFFFLPLFIHRTFPTQLPRNVSVLRNASRSVSSGTFIAKVTDGEPDEEKRISVSFFSIFSISPKASPASAPVRRPIPWQEIHRQASSYAARYQDAPTDTPCPRIVSKTSPR